jgi:GxxExxY protein
MQLISNKNLLYPQLSYQINGILFAVRKNIGAFSNEHQYCDAIEAILKDSNIPYQREAFLPASFANEGRRNRVDFIIDNKIVLEVKAKPFITKNDYYQTQRYLEALNKELAILVNMRRYYINPKRILNSKLKGSENSDKSS